MMAVGHKHEDKPRPWKNFTDEDIDKLWNTRCDKCGYRGSTGTDKCCDYILHTGHRRGCRPDQCDKFMQGKRRKLRVGIPSKKRSAVIREWEPSQKRHPRLLNSKTYFGRMLDKYVQEKGIDYTTFAQEAGVSIASVAKWRQGTQKIGAESMKKISITMDVDVEAVKRELEKGKIDESGSEKGKKEKEKEAREEHHPES